MLSIYSILIILIILVVTLTNKSTSGQVVEHVIVPVKSSKNGPKLFRIIPVVKTNKNANSPSVQVILPQNIPVAETNFSLNFGLNKEEIVQITNKKPADLIMNSSTVLTQSINQDPMSKSPNEMPQDISNITSTSPPSLPDDKLGKKKKKRKPKKKKKKIQSIIGTTQVNHITVPTLTTMLLDTTRVPVALTSTTTKPLVKSPQIDINKCVDHCDPVNQETSKVPDFTIKDQSNPTVDTLVTEPPSSPSTDGTETSTRGGDESIDSSTAIHQISLEPDSTTTDGEVHDTMSDVSSEPTDLPVTTMASDSETDSTTEIDTNEGTESSIDLIKSNSDVELDNLVENEVEVIPITLVVDANLMIDLGAKMLYEALDHKSIPQHLEEAKNKTLEVFDSLKTSLPIAPMTNFQLPSFDLPWNPMALSATQKVTKPSLNEDGDDRRGRKEQRNQPDEKKKNRKNKPSNNPFQLPQLSMFRLP